ncbi:MAG: nuclear transport factor 2 family protein [Candidatus Sulfotelmatobacter sp.]
MWRIFSVFLLLLFVRPQLNAQIVSNSDEHRRILALENAWNQAEQQKDSVALKMLLGPELVYIDYDGKQMSRAEYLAGVASASVHPERIVDESMNAHIYGAVAVVHGVCRESGAKNGKPYSVRMRFTDT